MNTKNDKKLTNNQKCWKYGERNRYCNCEYCNHVEECVRADYGILSEIMIDE